MLVPASEATPGDVCLPPSEAAVDAAMTRPSSAQLMMACLAVLLATLALLCYAANRNGECAQPGLRRINARLCRNACDRNAG